MKPWTTLDRRVEFSGGPIREIVRETVQLPDGRIINLEHLTYAERAGEYLSLHFDSGAEGGMGSVVRLKQGEGARRVWAYLAGKCTVKIEAT